MICSRILIGLAACVATAFLLSALAQLRSDVLIHDLQDSFGDHFPLLTRIVLPFSPIDWWSFISPIAIGVGAGAAIRSTWSIQASVTILTISLIQVACYHAILRPYVMVMAVMSELPRYPYPMEQFIGNASLVGVTVGTALLLVVRAVARAQAVGEDQIGEQDAALKDQRKSE